MELAVMKCLCIFIVIVAQGLAESFYDLEAKDVLEKETIKFNDFQGKVLLVTNTASGCGYTDGHLKSYRQLHNLLSRGGRFSILAFPCNQFGDQEPLTGKKLRQFVKEKYHGAYPVLEKCNVYGPKAHPVWKYINKMSTAPPSWNFWKYLIDHDGNFVKAWGPQTRVEDIFDEIKVVVDKAESALGTIETMNATDSGDTATAHSHGGEL